jgi:asparagine synthase (glutamine-hydrolysing)
MLNALRPHGPEHQTLWDDGPIALGRTLYRTLPEDSFDSQPLALRGGTHRLVADARLDNRGELASALGLSSQEAARLADSALLGRAWERWGADCLSRLIGDFAFIVWDAAERRLFAARDHFGRRNLVYYEHADFLAVATMPKGLFALAEVPRAVDAEKLAQSVASGRMGDDPELYSTRTFYRDVHVLPPRHHLTATAGRSSLTKYWEIEPQPTLRLARDADYAAQGREVFDLAVRARLRSAGDVGSELSAGLDSATITATAARLLGSQNKPLVAFTGVPVEGSDAVAPPGRLADEGPGAALVAARYSNIEHVLLAYPQASPIPLLSSMIHTADRTVGALNFLPILDQIGRAAQQRQLRVMLTGGMGNLTFTYDAWERLPILLWQGHWMSWAKEMRAMARLRRLPLARTAARHLMTALSPRWQRTLLERFSANERPVIPALGEAFAGRYLGSQGRYATLFAPGDRREPRRLWARRLSIRTGHTGDAFLRAGLLARYGIEYRDPSLDKRLVEFCLSLPLEQLQKNGRSRLLVRRMMQDDLPRDILEQRLRGHQGAGWLANLRAGQEEIRALLAGMRTSETGRAVLDLDRLELLADSIPDSGEDNLEVMRQYYRTLSQGVAAAQFIRVVEGGNA